MGIKSIIKVTFGQIINLRVTDWLNTKDHKNNLNYITSSFKGTFIPNTNFSNQETFEQAMQRLNLTEQDILERKKEFFKLFFISLIISLLLFIYTMLITINYKSFYGFILGTSISFLSLTKTFKYHFWLTQINKRKLGLTFKEWLN
ncbi:MAG: type IVB secretion system protein IcmV [Gammaproteobacteria bacterium]